MFRKIELSLVIGALACSVTAFAQTPQERIMQPIIVNGQQAQGALIVQDGTIQSQTCAAPQRYVAADQSSSGWACFEPSTGMWLLHAQPPLQTGPTIIYSEPAPVYVPAPTYAYGYYPFGYPYYPYYGYRYIYGPSFGFGFGFGFRSPIFINRPFVGGPFIVGRPVAPFVSSRPFVGGFRHGGMGFGRGGRR